MTFRSPYDREFEREQEIEHEAYQRGVDNILNKIRTEIMSLTNGDTPERIWNVDVLEIIDKYKAENEDKK